MTKMWGRIFFLIAALLYAAPAWSQSRDLNIDERNDRYVPDLVSQPTPPAPQPVKKQEYVFVPVEEKLTQAERVVIFNNRNPNKMMYVPPPGVESLKAKPILDLAQIPTTRTVMKKVPVVSAAASAQSGPKKPTVKLSLEVAETLESNASNTPTNAVSDSTTAVTPGIVVSIPTSDESLGFKVSASLTSLRYAELDDSSGDTATFAASMNKTVAKHRWAENKEILTSESLSLTATNNNNYDEGLGDWLSSNVVLQARWGFSNIPLSNKICGKGLCNKAQASLTGGQSFAANEASSNTFALLATEADFETPWKSVTLNVGARVRGRHYAEHPEDRSDLVSTVAAALNWGVTDEATLKLAATYQRQDSTLDAANWDGFIGTVSLNLEFDPCPADKKK